jgi:hypothetical protein
VDIARFTQIARDPRRTREELESLKANALSKGKVEFAHIANDVLLARFPVKGRHGGGPTPTTATFRTHSKDFESGKEAYVWLIEQFCRDRQDALERYVGLHRRTGAISKGCRFARNPDDLFPRNSRRTGNPAHYVRLSSGWHADTNLSHRDKFACLVQVSHVCGLEYGTDWDFRVAGATEELLEHQATIALAQRLLKDLLTAP